MNIKKVLKWILIALIIISFVFTGINGLFFNDEEQDVIASVGSQKIHISDFMREYKSHIYYLQSILGLDYRAIEQLHLVDMVLNHMIQENVLEELFKKSKFVISDSIAIDKIKNNQIFFTNDKFDKEKFIHFLSNIELTDAQYLNKVKFEIAKDMFFSSYFDIKDNYEGLSKKLYQNIYQKRTVGIAEVSKDINIELKTPTEEELKDFYNKHKDLFYTDEYRSAEYLLISQKDIKNDQIKQKIIESGLNKKINAKYIEFLSKEDAEKALNSIKENYDFYKNDIRQFKNPNIEDDIDLPVNITNELRNYMLYSEINLNDWQVTKIEERFYLIKVENIEKLSMLEEEQVMSKFKNQISRNILHEMAQDIENDLENDKNMQDIGKIYSIEYKNVQLINKNGKDKQNKAIELSKEVLKAIFAQKENKISGFLQLNNLNDTLIDIKVVGIEKPQIQQFSKVEKETKKLWQEDYKNKAIKSIVKKKLADGKFDKISYILRENTAIEDGIKQNLLPNLVEDIFDIKKDEITKIYIEDNNFIGAKLLDIKLPEENELKTAKIKQKIQQDFSLSLIAELNDFYKKKFKIKVNKGALKPLFP